LRILVIVLLALQAAVSVQDTGEMGNEIYRFCCNLLLYNFTETYQNRYRINEAIIYDVALRLSSVCLSSVGNARAPYSGS